jgi:cation:H+ antiporter
MWLWILAIFAGLALAMLASRRAVTHLTALAAGSRIPPFFFGITLVAIGTDLPEIANSIAASVTGHGDLNVGDSVGSAATQITLVLALFPFIVGAIPIKRSQVALVGGVTILSLAMGVVLFSDGELSRADAGILILAWLMASVALWRQGTLRAPNLEKSGGSRAYHAGVALVYLALVGLGATLAVMSFVEISEILSIPEYLISFFAASIGTSLPELFVDVTAIRKGEQQLAIGGIFGATLVDSTLSVAIGPLIAPTLITASLAVRGSVIAIGAVIIATLLLTLTRRHTYKTGLVLLLAYAAIYPLLILMR